MLAQYLEIRAKHRQMTGFHASLADFSVTPCAAVSADVLCADPALSLYPGPEAPQRGHAETPDFVVPGTLRV